MTEHSRDDFSERVKRTVAERAAYICTNPTCRRPAVGPHSDPDRSLKTGEAGHIRAVAPGGPRYSPEQTESERASIENAIWVCATCHTLVDGDEAAYPVQALLEWKRNHEAWIENGGIIPCLPEVSLKTLPGRTIPEVVTTITLGDSTGPREHSLRIRNVADAQIVMIDARVQLPEPIVESFAPRKPAGISVGWQPSRPEMMVIGSPGATFARNRPPPPAKAHQLQIDRLPPSHHVEIRFLTSTGGRDDQGRFGATSDPWDLRSFIDGTFQFEYRGAVLKRRFFAPIHEDIDNRRWSILEVREDDGPWKPQTIGECL